MKIIWSPEAAEDLEEAFEYISQDNPNAALDIFFKVKDRIETLKDYPDLGRIGRVPGTMELVVIGTPFIAPYKIIDKNKTIEIIRIFHTSRKWPEQF